jgi:hypothetical protein
VACVVENLQVDAAAEFLDEVGEKENVSASTKVNGQVPTRRAFVPYAVSLVLSPPDLSLPDNRPLGISYLEIGLGTETFAGAGDQNEQAPTVRRNRPVPLSIAPEAVKFTAGQRVLKEPGLEGFTGRAPVRAESRVRIRRDLFTSAPGKGDPEEEE